MKNKILYVNGCSFAYGIGIDRTESESIKYRFSAKLAYKLGYDEMNRAIPGSCNARIGRRVALDLYRYKPELSIIIWSDPARFEFIRATQDRAYRYGEDAEQVRPLSIYNYPRDRRDSFIKYYEYISSSYRDVLYTLQEMLTIKSIADSLGLKCIQIPFKGTFHRELIKGSSHRHDDYLNSLNEYLDILSEDKLIFGIDNDISFDSISGCDINPGMLSTVPNQEGHPNKESHEIMSEWLYGYIRRNDL